MSLERDGRGRVWELQFSKIFDTGAIKWSGASPGGGSHIYGVWKSVKAVCIDVGRCDQRFQNRKIDREYGKTLKNEVWTRAFVPDEEETSPICLCTQGHSGRPGICEMREDLTYSLLHRFNSERKATTSGISIGGLKIMCGWILGQFLSSAVFGVLIRFLTYLKNVHFWITSLLVPNRKNCYSFN